MAQMTMKLQVDIEAIKSAVEGALDKRLASINFDRMVSYAIQREIEEHVKEMIIAEINQNYGDKIKNAIAEKVGEFLQSEAFTRLISEIRYRVEKQRF